MRQIAPLSGPADPMLLKGSLVQAPDVPGVMSLQSLVYFRPVQTMTWIV